MCISPCNFFQKSLNSASRTCKYSESIELVFRVAAKAIKFYIEFIRKQAHDGWKNLQSQLHESSEWLGVLQTIHCITEIVCPDKQGLYLFQKHSKAKFLGRICLLFYSIFRAIKLIKNLGFIQLKKIEKIVFWNISRLRCATIGTYILYRTFYAYESVYSKTWWKVAVSIGKIAMTILEIMITAKKIYLVPLLFIIRGTSLGIDSFDMSKKIGLL